MTTRELSRFGQFCLDGGVWRGRRLLSREWFALALARQTWSGGITVNSQALGSGSDWKQGYGFQFWRCRHGVWRCDGAYGQLTVGFPDQDAVLSVHAGFGDMQDELNLIWDILLPDGSVKLCLRLTGTTGLIDVTLRPDGTLDGRVWCLDVYRFAGRVDGGGVKGSRVADANTLATWGGIV